MYPPPHVHVSSSSCCSEASSEARRSSGSPLFSKYCFSALCAIKMNILL
jgi:hypothetical protein